MFLVYLKLSIAVFRKIIQLLQTIQGKPGLVEFCRFRKIVKTDPLVFEYYISLVGL